MVDDEPQIHKMLGILLDVENYKIVESTSGKEAIRLCISTKPDLILLDLGLPDMDGKEVITAVREWSQVPIIVLSARCSDEEISTALNMGANDYVTKPFNIDVLLARMNAALRSSAAQETGDSELCNGPLRINLVRHEVFLDDKIQTFTPKEYDLLRHFIVNRGKMLTHKEILKTVWGTGHTNDVTYLRVFIGQIRGKIEKHTTVPVLITTEPGIGYRMEVYPDNASSRLVAKAI